MNIQMDTMEIKIHFETRSPTNKELREFPKLKMTGKNERNPSSVSLGSADSTRDQIQVLGFKEQLLATIPRKIAKNNKIQQCAGKYINKANILFDR